MNKFLIDDNEVGLAPEGERPEDYELALSLGNIPADPPATDPNTELTPEQAAAAASQVEAQLPEYLADFPAEQQPALLDALLARLDPAVVANLPSVNRLLHATATSTEGHLRQSLDAERQRAESVVTFQNLMEPVAGYMTETQQAAYQSQLEAFSEGIANSASAAEMRRGVAAAYGQFGLDLAAIPAEVRQAAADVETAGEAAAIYMTYLASAVQQHTEATVTTRERGRAGAEGTADAKRREHEALGNLAKAGRIRITPDGNGEYWATLAAEAPPGLGDNTGNSRFTGINPDSYRALNDNNEPVDPAAVDAWTAQYANADA